MAETPEAVSRIYSDELKGLISRELIANSQQRSGDLYDTHNSDDRPIRDAGAVRPRPRVQDLRRVARRRFLADRTDDQGSHRGRRCVSRDPCGEPGYRAATARAVVGNAG